MFHCHCPFMHFPVAKGNPITVYPALQIIYAVIPLLMNVALAGSSRDGHLARC